MNKLAALLALSTVLAFGTAAKAADIVEAPLCHDWRGPYVGGFVGYSPGKADWSDGDVDFDHGGTRHLDPEGWLYGPLAGWNFQSDCFVFGIEGDWGFGEADDSAGVVDDFDIEPNGHIRGRAGYAWGEFMPFIAGGLALADVDIRVDGAGNDSQLHTGFSIGGGWDWAVYEGVTLRFEYLFDKYNSESYEFNHNISADADAQQSTFRGAVIWNFGSLF